MATTWEIRKARLVFEAHLPSAWGRAEKMRLAREVRRLYAVQLHKASNEALMAAAKWAGMRIAYVARGAPHPDPEMVRLALAQSDCPLCMSSDPHARIGGKLSGSSSGESGAAV